MNFKVSRGVRGFLLLAPVLCFAMLSAKVSAAELLYSMKVITYPGRYLIGENCATMVYKNEFSDMCRSTRDKAIGSLRLTMLPQEPIGIAFLVDPGENGGGDSAAYVISGSMEGNSQIERSIIDMHNPVDETLLPYRLQRLGAGVDGKIRWLVAGTPGAAAVQMTAKGETAPVCQFVVEKESEVELGKVCPTVDFSREDLGVKVIGLGSSPRLCFEGRTGSDSSCYSASSMEFFVPKLGGADGAANVTVESKGNVRGKVQKVKYYSVH
ncbi:hypothetical protein [Pseudomonas sp. CCOS 191]|uniref:hypothetical protein n=1 Tax=Pseudomonas sp. CCOS 191 TaxID=1649877 RepID=UPI0018E66C25|nr:hypothetical protein [Pseudomonas sp. CCOS 191]MBI6954729.1 hypothetical protein [Pseudomonas sp. CCOS 191]